MGNYKPFPFKIPFTRPVTIPFKRPFDVSDDCVLCLIPEIRTKWFDQSINGNDGVIENCTKVDGRFGMGLYFNGVNSVVTIPYNSSLYTSEITFNTWLWVDDLTGNVTLLRYFGNQGYNIFVTSNGTIYISIRNVGDTTNITHNSAAGTISTGQWYHIVISYSETAQEVKFYVDKVNILSEAHTTGHWFENQIIHVGTNWNTSWFMNGKIDELEIFNRIFTQEDVDKVYEAGKPEG